MATMIKLQSFLDFIKERMRNENIPKTIIHIYDYGRKERVFDIEISPYEKNTSQQFKISKDRVEAYESLYESIKDVCARKVEIDVAKDSVFGGSSLKLIVNKRIWIIFKYYTNEGKEWIEKIYMQEHSKF